jgi:hypothetical protein
LQLSFKNVTHLNFHLNFVEAAGQWANRESFHMAHFFLLPFLPRGVPGEDQCQWPSFSSSTGTLNIASDSNHHRAASSPPTCTLTTTSTSRIRQHQTSPVMCTGIIGQCQCFRCMDHPTPGKLLRIEFCPKQQDYMVGVWNPSSPEIEKLTPCANLTFDRVREPDACHFKKKDDTKEDSEVTVNKLKQPEDPQKDETTKDTASSAVTSSTNSVGDFTDPGIRFAPINAAEAAMPALTSPTKNKASPTKGNASPTKRIKTAAEDKVGDGDKADKMDKTASETHKANITDNNVDKGNDKDDDKMDIDPPFATTDTATGAGAGQKSPTKPTSNAPPLTPSSRKRLPDNRPRTPKVLEATAAAASAAAAAEAASRVPDGQWTHEETIKLLALRAKGIELEGMGQVSSLFTCRLLTW